MKPRPNPFLRFTAVVALACVGSGYADTLTWNNGASTGNWNTSDANWTGDTWDNSVPDSAIFGATGVGTVTLNTGISVDDITFDAVGYTVAGNTLTILGGGSVITANADASIGSNIAGGNLVKQGSATLSLSGSNSYNNGTVIDHGTLEITSIDGATSNVGSAWLAMDNSSTLRYIGTGAESTTRDFWINNNAGTRTFDIANAGASLTLGGGGGQINRSIRKAGDGTLVIGKVVAGGDATLVDAGVLEVSTAGKLYGAGYTASPVITVNSGATLRLNGWSWDAAGSIANLDFGRDRLVVNGGTLEYTGNSNFNPGDAGSSSRNLTVGTGGATLKASSPSGQTWTIHSANGNLINDNGLTLDGAGAGEIQKVIEGTGSVTKTGAGTWTLSGANTYTGPTTVTAGTLSLSSPSLENASSVLIGSGAILNLNFSGNDIVGSLAINGSGPLPADGIWEEPANWAANTIATGFNNTATFNAATGATVTLTGGQTIGNLAFDVSDYSIAGPGAITLDSSSTPIVSVATDRSATISANVAGISGLEKTGAGTLVLTGMKTYTGGTTVTSGTLELQGASFGNAQIHGSLNVNTGATVLFTGGDGTGFGYFNSPVTSTTVNGGTIDAAGSSHLGFGLAASMTLDNGGTILGNWQWNGDALLSFYSYGDSTNTIDATLNLRNDVGPNHSFNVDDGASPTDLLISGSLAGGGSNVIKNGTGTLVLSGANTYSGNTIVNGGSLELTSTSQMQFVVTDAPASNQITGTGSATFDGVFNINTAAVSGATGHIWLLVDRPSLTGESFGTNFSVAGFTQQGDGVTWTMTDSRGSWSFSENSGELALVVSDYNNWGAAYGLGSGSEGGDLDNDGLTNGEEYAFGLLPNNGSSVNAIVVPLEKTGGTFSYTRRLLSLTDLTYKVWYSTDLGTWVEDTGATEGTPAASGDVETVPVMISPALLTNTKLFIQVRAE